MWNNFIFSQGMHAPLGLIWLVPVFFILIPIVFALKGYALWNAAKRGELLWFIAIFIINTFGILELVYIFGVMKKKIDFGAPIIKDVEPKHEHKHEDHHHHHASPSDPSDQK